MIKEKEAKHSTHMNNWYKVITVEDPSSVHIDLMRSRFNVCF